MGAVYDEFVEQLKDWRTRYAGHPDKEMIRLWMLGLEREQIVSVAYREEMISRRLAGMPLPEEARDVMRHALLWAWKDEEMHTLYIRGALLRRGQFAVRAEAYLQQMQGAVGGWTSAVQQHVRWSEAPVSRAIAGTLTGVGLVTGKVPRGVAREMQFRPFRDFCAFNVDAERTAALCWERLTELTSGPLELPADQVAEFRRMWEDEKRHERVFAALGESLDEHDHLLPGESAATLVQKIAPIGDFFLPRSLRRASVSGSPLGKGGTVHVAHDAASKGPAESLGALLDHCDLPRVLEARSKETGKPVASLTVAVKTAFMLGYSRKDLSPIVGPELLRALGAWLHAKGIAVISVLESPNIYDTFYDGRSVAGVARYFGIGSPHFTVLDAVADQIEHAFDRGMAQHTVSRAWAHADVRISFGKMRSHPTDLVYLACGNAEGLGTRNDSFLFAERQAARDTATLMLMNDFPPHFALLDAFENVPDGMVGMMGSPRPKTPRRLYAAEDTVALDAVAARHLGLADPRWAPLLRGAFHWFGDPRAATRVDGIDAPIANWRSPYKDEWSSLLSLLAYPVYRHASGRGALFVPEMDQAAFPEREAPSMGVRAGRRAVRSLLGLGLPA